MDFWIAVALAIVALGVGIWIGVGAPGWPHQERYHRHHDSKRSLNPIAWGRRGSRERAHRFGDRLQEPGGGRSRDRRR